MKHKTILLVEDDYLDIVSFQRTLSKLNVNHTLHIAHNGTEALEMLNGSSASVVPDIILLDINMPKMNGLEFLKAFRSEGKFKDIKVFIMTTSAEEYDKVSAHAHGISGYIIKPLDFDNYHDRSSSMDTFDLLMELLMK